MCIIESQDLLTDSQLVPKEREMCTRKDEEGVYFDKMSWAEPKNLQPWVWWAKGGEQKEDRI